MPAPNLRQGPWPHESVTSGSIGSQTAIYQHGAGARCPTNLLERGPNTLFGYIGHATACSTHTTGPFAWGTASLNVMNWIGGLGMSRMVQSHLQCSNVWGCFLPVVTLQDFPAHDLLADSVAVAGGAAAPGIGAGTLERHDVMMRICPTVGHPSSKCSGPVTDVSCKMCATHSSR